MSLEARRENYRYAIQDLVIELVRDGWAVEDIVSEVEYTAEMEQEQIDAEPKYYE